MIALLLKATVILVAGWAATLLLHRRSAALRHLVWTATLGAVLLLSLAQPVLPTLPVQVGVLAPAESFLGSPTVVNPPREPAFAAAVTDEPASTVTPAAEPLSTPAILLRVWLAGFAAVVGWCLLGRLGLARLLHRATPLTDPAWSEDLERQQAPARITRPIRLFLSSQVGSPVTWAIRHPVIVLPPEARSWNAERRRVVLAHELAHIVRGDGMANLIAWAGSAAYWFHPLAWFAARRLRAESERAADDFVLAQGVSPVDYAAHLLDVARGSRWLRLQGATAIGMARPHTLEGRLLAVLDETRNRLAPKAITRRAAWTLSAALVLPFASLLPVMRPAPVPAQAFQGDTINESLPARPGDLLVLDLKTGANVRIEGWDQPTVQIRGARGGPDWKHTMVRIHPEPNGVKLETWAEGRGRQFSTNHHFDIRVPKSYDVRISSAGGAVTIIGVEGSFSGTSGGGDITIERARGQATLSTGGGDIRVSESTLDGRVSTGGGKVLMDRVKGDLKGSSGSGPVIQVGNQPDEKRDLRDVRVKDERIEVGPNTDGTIHIEKAGGGIDLARAPRGAEVQTGGGDIRIGEGNGEVSANTGGGDITIGPVNGSIEAWSGAGTLRVSLSNTGGSVKLGTGNGSASIELPAGFTGRFELETAYTRNNARTRIRSDWDLTQTETTEWDYDHGSPRKYVRATGRVGNGPGVITVVIVNGDITVRRR